MAYKTKLTELNIMTPARNQVLNQQILANVDALVKQGENEKANELAKIISWDKVKNYNWFKQIGVSGWAASIGSKVSIPLFYHANQLLGRA